MQPRASRFGQPDVTRHGQSLGNRRRGGQPEPRGGLTIGCRRRSGEGRILRMGHRHEIEAGGILQQPVHGIGRWDRVAAGRDADGTRFAHQADLGEVMSFQTARRGRQRVHPNMRLADALCPVDDRGVVEWRRLVRHQHDPGNAPRQARGGIGTEHARVDQTRCRHEARSIDHLGASPVQAAAQFRHLAVAQQDVRRAVDAGNGIDHARAADQQRAHVHSSTPLRRRVSTSRQAMRTATPISTCCVIADR